MGLDSLFHDASFFNPESSIGQMNFLGKIFLQLSCELLSLATGTIPARPAALTHGLLALLGMGALLLIVPGHGTVVGVMAFGLANRALTLAQTELLMKRYPAAQFGTVNGRMALQVNLALTPFASA